MRKRKRKQLRESRVPHDVGIPERGGFSKANEYIEAIGDYVEAHRQILGSLAKARDTYQRAGYWDDSFLTDEFANITEQINTINILLDNYGGNKYEEIVFADGNYAHMFKTVRLAEGLLERVQNMEFVNRPFSPERPDGFAYTFMFYLADDTKISLELFLKEFVDSFDNYEREFKSPDAYPGVFGLLSTEARVDSMRVAFETLRKNINQKEPLIEGRISMRDKRNFKRSRKNEGYMGQRDRADVELFADLSTQFLEEKGFDSLSAGTEADLQSRWGEGDTLFSYYLVYGFFNSKFNDWGIGADVELEFNHSARDRTMSAYITISFDGNIIKRGKAFCEFSYNGHWTSIDWD